MTYSTQQSVDSVFILFTLLFMRLTAALSVKHVCVYNTGLYANELQYSARFILRHDAVEGKYG